MSCADEAERAGEVPVALHTHVEVELVDESGDTERLAFDLVADAQADFARGLLAIGAPLARAILGHKVGDEVSYRAGDIVRVRIVRVSPVAAAPPGDTAAQREAIIKQAVARAEPETLDMPEVVFPLAVCLHSMGDHARAEPLLVRALASDLTPEMRASALIRLGEICAKGGRGREADQHYERALSIPGIDPTVRRELERRRQSR